MKKPTKDWDQFRFNFIRESVRRRSLAWPPRNMAKVAARTQRKVNPATGKLCWHVKCAICSIEVLEKEGQLDHKIPVVDPNMSEVRKTLKLEYTEEHIGSYMRRMLPDQTGFQVLCSGCHDIKTRSENEQRKQYRQEVRSRKAKVGSPAMEGHKRHD